MEYGHFKRRDRGDRDHRDNRDRDRDRRDFRDRGGDRGGFRGRERNSERDPEESVFSQRVRAGKRRTYFFDVRKTRGDDYFITITESTRREDGYGYKRHKIFLYKEDFNRFAASLNEVVNHVKTELMPDFDYEEFDRRQAEWEAQNRDADEDAATEDSGADDSDVETAKPSKKVKASDETEADDAADESSDQPKDEDEMSW
ncbi:MAG: DUF3276 family protein [Saprospiraceae bacterium]|nr:DUF3276 family protein [Lewinellaceae bacterium]